MLLLASAVLGQDLFRRAPLLCDKVPVHQRPSALDTTIPEIQNTTQPGPPPTQSTEMCMNTMTTAGSAGHTFPSAYAGRAPAAGHGNFHRRAFQEHFQKAFQGAVQGVFHQDPEGRAYRRPP